MRALGGQVIARLLALRSGTRLETGLTIGAFVVFLVLWVGLLYSRVVDPGLPDDAWAWLRGLEPPVQAAVWVGFLPIALGLWIWTSSWPPLVGAFLGLGIVAWSVASVARFSRLILGRIRPAR